MADKAKEKREGISDLKPSDADAPGPITSEHESGSYEQTLAEQDARAKLDEVRSGGSSSKPAAKPASSKSSS